MSKIAHAASFDRPQIPSDVISCMISFDHACGQSAIHPIAAHVQARRKLVHDVNISGKSLEDPWLPVAIEGALVEAGINPTGLRNHLFLATALFVLGKTIPAIHWTIFPGFERDFALLFAVGTDGLMHLSRTSVVLSILKSHFLFLHDIDIFRDIDC
jgi:hypothetical protein